MVLGLRTKTRKGTSVQVDYVILIQEIKPWPPSQSLKTLRSVVLQWQNGDRNSGCTNAVLPSNGSGVGDGKIEFNDSIKLTATLSKELSVKGGETNTFQKNCLELNLYEPRRDSIVKGQHLGNAMIDLADYGIIKETVSVSVPMNCKRSFRNMVQPVLFVKIQPFDKDATSSSSKESLSKEASLDKEGRESVSALMGEEYADEAEIASFSDDDGSSHSSLTVSSSAFETSADSPSQNDTIGSRILQEEIALAVEKRGRDNSPSETVPVKSVVEPLSEVYVSNQAILHQNGSSSRASSIDFLESGNLENNDATTSNFPESNLTVNPNKPGHVQSSVVSIDYESTKEEIKSNHSTRGFDSDDLVEEVDEKVVDDGGEMKENVGHPTEEENNTNGILGRDEDSDSDLQVREKQKLVSPDNSDANENKSGKSWRQHGSDESLSASGIHQMVTEEKDEDKHVENGQEVEINLLGNGHLINHCSDSTPFNHQNRISQELSKTLPSVSDSTTFSRRGLEGKSNSTLTNDKLKRTKFSVRSSLSSAGSITSVTYDQLMEEVKEIDILEDANNDARSFIADSGNNGWGSGSLGSDKVKHVSRETVAGSSERKIKQLEGRIEMLEGELREAAAVEIGLYSIIAEHGISTQKVHAPARRLSRLYIHASKNWSQRRRASVARSVASGLVLVAKACGNDVPRLTFWLSNSIVLRTIITQAVGDSHLPISSGPLVETNGAGNRTETKSSRLKWKESPINKKEKRFALSQSFNDCDDPHTFVTALENTEAWIFSRIIESLWWQTLTPHMQSATEEVRGQKMVLNSRKSYGRKHSLGDQQQGNFSIELWKKAFRDACERICPVRGAGHECGCLSLMGRLVMEQCVARLDVAMFNAILRESDDEIPTDPVSDPISNSKVLPIPSGKSSFGAGAQLKNAIGTWSRWLTDLFGIDEDDSPGGVNGHDDDRQEAFTSLKPFYLLNALSDLLMLPKDMLLDRSIRKEVCPTFDGLLIKRILNSFVPDEFCPDPIPEVVLEALDSEDPLEEIEGSIKNFPCNAAPIVYSPPATGLVAGIIGALGNQSHLRRSGSSVLRKCHTSDDELDELDSPLAIIDKLASPTPTGWKSKENGGNTVRFQLLREVWRDEN
ncbi:uncharacterized protein LOC143847132 [Tasmannia lanceolata]|uniref:uncharacterized protein LOC143847132 n=1 Tax=Tasmannia lanceolata TaxID=3420 RepID=UPI004063119B